MRGKINKANLWSVVGLAVVVAMGASALVVPRLQSSRLQLNEEVNIRLERARRLLATYDANLSLDADLRNFFGEEAFKITSDQVSELLENPDVDIAGEADAQLDDYAKRTEVKSLTQREQELLTLVHGSTNWSQYKTPAPPARLTGPAMVTTGTAAFEKKLSANSKLLDEAQKEVAGALALTRGGLNARQHVAANRLQGKIHYQKGLAAARQVSLLRGELGAQRLEIQRRSDERSALIKGQAQVAASGVDGRIAEAEAEHKAMAATLEKQRQTEASLRSRVGDLNGRLTGAVARGEAAREAMEALQELGVDLTNPRGFEEFRRTYEEQAGNYHAALSDAHVAEHGTLLNAAIDRSGDYLRGKYVPSTAGGEITIERGLKHVRQDLERAQTELQQMEETAARLEENIQSLKNMKRLLEERVQKAVELASQIQTQIETAHSEYRELGGRVREVEDQALAHFEKAAGSFKTAATGVSAEESEARSSKPTNPQRAGLHYLAASEDQAWLRGQITAQQADAELQAAAILLGRYQDAQANSADLGAVEAAADDLTGWKESEKSTQADAITRIEAAIETLQSKAKNPIGNGNWTVAAEIGAAHYLLSLLGVELADQRALEWYKAAVEGREDIAAEHVAMRNYIEARLDRAPAAKPDAGN